VSFAIIAELRSATPDNKKAGLYSPKKKKGTVESLAIMDVY